MALTYITGHDLNLTLTPTGGSATTYDDVCTSATLAIENEQVVIETLNGRAYKTVAKTATLTADIYQDWGSSSPTSVCKALFDAANSTPDDTIAATLVVNGVTFTFDIFPNYPAVGGAANDVLTSSVTFVVKKGIVTRTPA
jgi:hypothetical protein